ncbi:MAG: hypothetical protein K2O42_09235 [Oscillospiraceae bacterium]|nr:hypothetical protein [Oscillospiraceae bacterium]
MNEKELQNAVKEIKLPEESRKNIIRKLESLSGKSGEEFIFHAEPARLPIFRYALSGVMACAIIAVSAGGLLQLTRTPSESQSQFAPGGSIQDYNSQNLSASEQSSTPRLYAIFPESDKQYSIKQYCSLSDSDTSALLDALQITLASRDSDDFKTTFMVGGKKEFIICAENNWLEFWKEDNTISVLIQHLENSEMQSYCIGISPEEYNSIKALLANPLAYFDLPVVDYAIDLYPQDILHYLFLISPFGDVSQMQERLIFSDYKLQYIIPTEEQHAKLAELLNRAAWKEIQVEDLDTSASNSENSEEFFTIYFATPGERFTVHFSSHITVTGDHSQKLYELYDPYENSDLASQIRELFLPAETRYQLDNRKNNLFEQLFDEEPVEVEVNQEAVSPFGDFSQMQERAIFVEYAPLYLIPTDEQHEKLAELLNQAEWEQLPSDDKQIPILEDGEFFQFYFNNPDNPENPERFTLRFQMSGLITDNANRFYYNPELISEIRDVLIPAETRYQLRNPDEFYLLSTEQIFEQLFDEEPIEFDPDSDLDSNSNPVTIQLGSTPILIHDESFSKDAQGNYHVENDTQYLISQERKQQLSVLVASQELQAIVGFPDFEKGESYQKFVIEFTEQDGFLTLEYDIEHSQYYLILCTQMEIPGDPVETGSYTYFPVTEEFYQNWNALLANPEN